MSLSLPEPLLAEWRQLSERDRRVVLGALTAGERRAVMAMVGSGDAVPSPAASAWLTALRGEAARVVGGGVGTRLTLVAAEALIGGGTATDGARARGPSLLDGLRQALPRKVAGR